MAGHVELKGQQVHSILEGAAQRHLSGNIATHHQNRWLSFRTRFLAVSNDSVLLEMPVAIEEGVVPEKVLPGAECNVSVRVQSYRFFFTAKLEGPMAWKNDMGATVQALAARIPAMMARCERRSHPRYDLPSNQTVRASIWAGVEQKPVWSGKVLNLSVSGLQLRTSLAAIGYFDPGDTINVGLSFGDNEKAIIDAHFRQGTMDGDMAMIGLEFVPLHTNESGRAALKLITRKIEEYSK